MAVRVHSLAMRLFYFHNRFFLYRSSSTSVGDDALLRCDFNAMRIGEWSSCVVSRLCQYITTAVVHSFVQWNSDICFCRRDRDGRQFVLHSDVAPEWQWRHQNEQKNKIVHFHRYTLRYYGNLFFVQNVDCCNRMNWNPDRNARTVPPLWNECCGKWAWVVDWAQSGKWIYKRSISHIPVMRRAMKFLQDKGDSWCADLCRYCRSRNLFWFAENHSMCTREHWVKLAVRNHTFPWM